MLDIDWTYLIKAFLALFAISDPIGTVPLFLTLTGDHTPSERRRTLFIMVSVATFIFLGALVAGESILEFFGISLPAFRIAGGLLLLLVAVDMLNARPTRTKRTPDEAEEAQDRDSIAIMPLAVPMLAGPGAISTIIVYSNQSEDWSYRAALVFIILVVAAVSWTILHLAAQIGHKLGRTGINIVSRLMGLILAAIGVEFIMHGIGNYYPAISTIAETVK